MIGRNDPKIKKQIYYAEKLWDNNCDDSAAVKVHRTITQYADHTVPETVQKGGR